MLEGFQIAPSWCTQQAILARLSVSYNIYIYYFIEANPPPRNVIIPNSYRFEPRTQDTTTKHLDIYIYIYVTQIQRKKRMQTLGGVLCCSKSIV